MSNLQVKNVPNDLYERLRSYADERNSTISAVVLTAVERELDKASMTKRLAERSSVELTSSSAELVRQERVLRESETEYNPFGSDADQARGEDEEEEGKPQ